MSLANILFIIVMLHLVVGFGYVVYKLEFSGKKKKKDEGIDKEKTSDDFEYIFYITLLLKLSL